jgi:putative transcriptional regulator
LVALAVDNSKQPSTRETLAVRRQAAPKKSPVRTIFVEFGKAQINPFAFTRWSVKLNSMNLLQGQFLIASPHLRDPNFAQSVVLVLEHHDEGALGVIINRDSQLALRDVWRQVDDSPCDCEACVSLGGPVQGPMIALHGHPQYSEAEIVAGVYVATERDKLCGLVDQNLQPFRVFTGYAGWGPGQLEGELEAGGWLRAAGNAEHVFSQDVTGLWHDILKTSGQDFFRETLGIQNFPGDAGLN